MGGGFNEAAILPNTEGLQEVRVISNNFTADYGHGQSVISFSTKSGTNQYHGQADYMLRNEALNANTNSNKANGLLRSPFKVNQLGAPFPGRSSRTNCSFRAAIISCASIRGRIICSPSLPIWSARAISVRPCYPTR